MRHRSSRRSLNAQAKVFAKLLSGGNGFEGAYQTATSLAEGLFPHQVEGVAFLLGRRRAILADDMGLGKTRQAITALRHAAPAGPYLIVCPASVKGNWGREIAAVSDDPVHIVSGSRAQTIPPDARWVVCNYDILATHVEAIGAVGWAGLVFDEAHYLKNHTSARSRIARQIAASATAIASREPALYLLTGTPLTNRPRDLFVLLQLAGHPLGRSFLSFARRYCAAARTEYGWRTDGASNLEELTVQLHGVMLRRRKDQVVALPPKLRAFVPTPVEHGLVDREIREVLALLLVARRPDSARSNGARARTNLLSMLTKARQKLAVAKAATTLDFVAGAVDQGEKVIVFSCFDAPLKTLAKRFGDSAVVLTGATASSKRQSLVDRFQTDDGVRVFLANIVAGGTGLNLTAATQVVFNDLDWVPANHWQAEDRAYRLGQTRTVNVTYVVGEGTIDDFVQAVLETKAGLVRTVVDGEAVSGEMVGGVLEELERALAALSPGLVDTDGRTLDQETIASLLQEAASVWRTTHAAEGAGEAVPKSPAELRHLQKALEALARVLAGPAPERIRIESSSRPGTFYEITIDGSDVSCTCPGFEHRGQCRHARDVKHRLVKGR
jgi:SWI/SNF-related matrix-associated actin-dependent regulator of chromatin subfamily A-like protein 1